MNQTVDTKLTKPFIFPFIQPLTQSWMILTFVHSSPAASGSYMDMDIGPSDTLTSLSGLGGKQSEFDRRKKKK